MSPRARRSESITLPPGNHPGLIRYNDEKSYSEACSSPESHAETETNHKRRPSVHRIPSMESSLYDDPPSGSETEADLRRRNDFDYDSDVDHESSYSDESA